jgi:hypothetical protein
MTAGIRATVSTARSWTGTAAVMRAQQSWVRSITIRDFEGESGFS